MKWRFVRFVRSRSFQLWVGGILALLLILVVAADVLLDEPLRRYIERRVNAALTGYTVQIHSLDFHVLGFSIALKDTVVLQNAHPDPPVAFIPKLSASVQWKALLSARLVADFIFYSPEVHLDLKQLSEESRDAIPVSDKGWQDALEAIYPLKVNELRVQDGTLVYKDEGDYRPLRLSHVSFLARNIRNIKSRDHVYPSEVHLEGAVFDSGSLQIDGHADFLAKPHPGVKANLTLERMDVTYFEPIVRRYNLSVKGGTVSSDGEFEYAPRIRSLNLENVEIEGAAFDYVHTAETDTRERHVAAQISQAASEVNNALDLILRIGSLRLHDGKVAFVNKAGRPGYRVYVSGADLELKNLSNQERMGNAVGRLSGKFMGSGSLKAETVFRAETEGSNFDLKLRIDETQMPAMNDLLRTYGKFDVVAGIFSFYTEIRVRKGEMTGYVKPLFRDLNVYDPVQDRKKNILRKVYEGLVGGVAKVLENRRDEVATVTKLSGPVGNARTSTLEIIGGLIKNAFFKAILPGFEREVSKNRRMGLRKMARKDGASATQSLEKR